MDIMGMHTSVVQVVADHLISDKYVTITYSVQLEKDSETKITISDSVNTLATYDYNTQVWWITDFLYCEDHKRWQEDFEKIRDYAIKMLYAPEIKKLLMMRWRMPTPDPAKIKKVSPREIIRDEYDDGMVVIEEYSVPREGRQDTGWGMIDDGFMPDPTDIQNAFNVAQKYAKDMYYGALGEIDEFGVDEHTWITKDFDLWYRVHLDDEHNDMTFYMLHMTPENLTAYSLNKDDDWSERVVENWTGEAREKRAKYQ